MYAWCHQNSTHVCLVFGLFRFAIWLRLIQSDEDQLRLSLIHMLLTCGFFRVVTKVSYTAQVASVPTAVHDVDMANIVFGIVHKMCQ